MVSHFPVRKLIATHFHTDHTWSYPRVTGLLEIEIASALMIRFARSPFAEIPDVE